MKRPNPKTTKSVGVDVEKKKPGGSPSPTPSFKGLLPASEVSSRAKKMNRNSNTAHERLLRILLWRRGLRYRKNVRTLPGKPDIVFFKSRVVVFCDGDFWHGRNWHKLSRKLQTGSNAPYWISKIQANRDRDQRTKRLLEKDGWTVIRIWETDIHNNPDQAVSTVEKMVLRKRGIDAIR